MRISSPVPERFAVATDAVGTAMQIVEAAFRRVIRRHDDPVTPDLRATLKSRQPYGAMIEQAAGEFGIDAALLHAVIAVESAYNTNAVSRHGAGGLMQLMPGTAKRYGVANVFDPADNVRGGAQYLAELNKLFRNNLQLVIAAYNAGEQAVLRNGNRIPPYRETTAYVPHVIAYYQKFRLQM